MAQDPALVEPTGPAEPWERVVQQAGGPSLQGTEKPMLAPTNQGATVQLEVPPHCGPRRAVRASGARWC